MPLAAQLEAVVRREAATKFGRAVKIVDDRLDRTVPRRTGRLSRSRRTVLSTSGSTMSADITYTTTPDYGQFLDEGVRPHPIRARRGGTLRFVIGGQVLYRRSVFHPGTNKHRGWFSRPTSAADWRLVLDRVFGQ